MPSVALRAFSLIEHRCFLNQTNNAWLLVLITRKYVNLFKLSCTQICHISQKPNGNVRLVVFNTHVSNDDQVPKMCFGKLHFSGQVFLS